MLSPSGNYQYIQALLNANINNESRAALFKKALYVDSRGATIPSKDSMTGSSLNQLLSDASQNLSALFQNKQVAL